MTDTLPAAEVRAITDILPDNSSTEASHAFAPWLEKTFDAGSGIHSYSAELVLLFGNTMLRAIWGQSIDWANEVAEFALTSLAFIGGAVAYHRGLHMSVHYVLDRLPSKLRGYGEAAGHYMTLVVAAIGIYLAYPMFSGSWSNWTPVLQIPKSWTLLPYIIGMVLLAIFAVRRLVRYPLRIQWAPEVSSWCWDRSGSGRSNTTGRWNGPGGILFASAALTGDGVFRRADRLCADHRGVYVCGERQIRRDHRRPVCDAEWDQQLHLAGGALLHLGREYHDRGGPDQTPGGLGVLVGGPVSRRAHAGRHRRHVYLFRDFGVQDRGCGRGWHRLERAC